MQPIQNQRGRPPVKPVDTWIKSFDEITSTKSALSPGRSTRRPAHASPAPLQATKQYLDCVRQAVDYSASAETEKKKQLQLQLKKAVSESMPPAWKHADATMGAVWATGSSFTLVKLVMPFLVAAKAANAPYFAVTSGLLAVMSEALAAARRKEGAVFDASDVAALANYCTAASGLAWAACAGRTEDAEDYRKIMTTTVINVIKRVDGQTVSAADLDGSLAHLPHMARAAGRSLLVDELPYFLFAALYAITGTASAYTPSLGPWGKATVDSVAGATASLLSAAGVGVMQNIGRERIQNAPWSVGPGRSEQVRLLTDEVNQASIDEITAKLTKSQEALRALKGDHKWRPPTPTRVQRCCHDMTQPNITHRHRQELQKQYAYYKLHGECRRLADLLAHKYMLLEAGGTAAGRMAVDVKNNIRAMGEGVKASRPEFAGLLQWVTTGAKAVVYPAAMLASIYYNLAAAGNFGQMGGNETANHSDGPAGINPHADVVGYMALAGVPLIFGWIARRVGVPVMQAAASGFAGLFTPKDDDSDQDLATTLPSDVATRSRSSGSGDDEWEVLPGTGDPDLTSSSDESGSGSEEAIEIFT